MIGKTKEIINTLEKVDPTLANKLKGINPITSANQEIENKSNEIYNEQKLREDTAWQREIADMRKAGINPNLVNLSANGAETGSGTETINTQLRGEIDTILQELEQEFKMNENQKNRVTLLLTGLINSATKLAPMAMGQ